MIYKEMLKENVAKVTFTKVDGSERVIRGTLKPELLPQKDSNKSSSSRKSNDNICPIFDLDKNDWRCFRVDSVKSFEVE